MRMLLTLSLAALMLVSSQVNAADAPEGRTFSVAEGKLTFTAPEGWVKKEPRSRIIEVEYEIPAAKGDETPGRLTVMGAGGAIDANIERWVGQFEQPGGEATKAKTEKLKVGDAEVHVVDLSGTFKDAPAGPFAGGKTVLRENYRMLGAIVATKDAGNYFLKLYGPKATITQNEKAFRSLIEGMKKK